jgi:uncharacterized protein YkwD
MLGLTPLATAQTTSAEAVSREMLLAHNQARSRVGVPPLTWSGKMAAVAQQWADQLLRSGKFTHRPKPQYGENLFEMRSASATPAQVVAAWAAEAGNYDVAGNTCHPGAVCGHYTQLVWRHTKRVGCGVARGQKTEIWVCNYDPPGNWVGERPY